MKRIGRALMLVLCSRNRGGMEPDDLLCSHNARPQNDARGASRPFFLLAERPR